ncbi:MAG: hypothetical protein ACRCUE_08140 [Bosea sp. (in: a-proteobacteria)]
MPVLTLADLWQEHADITLPIDAAQATVLAARREWYGQQLDRLAAIPNRRAHEEALFREAIQFGRLIGTALEAA